MGAFPIPSKKILLVLETVKIWRLFTVLLNALCKFPSLLRCDSRDFEENENDNINEGYHGRTHPAFLQSSLVYRKLILPILPRKYLEFLPRERGALSDLPIPR